MQRPVGVIAGQGQLPWDVVESLHRQDREVFVVRISGLTDSIPPEISGTTLSIGQIGQGIEALRAADCRDLVFVGYIKRPELADIQLDPVGMEWLPKIMAAAPEGDDAILGVFLSAFEEAGFNVLGAEQIYADLLCNAGVQTQAKPDALAKIDLKKAYHIAGVIGREDIGQACIVCEGLVLAVEAQEGTNLMLERVGRMDPYLRGSAEHRRGVLVKRTKPGQERRMDIPVIGPETIRVAAAAGLAGIGLEAGGALIIDRAETLRLADAAGLFIVGLSNAEQVE